MATILILCVGLGACSSGPVIVTPRIFFAPIEGSLTPDNCASYTENEQTFSGRRIDVEGDAFKVCAYSTNFVDFDKELHASITLSNEIDRHLFLGSLVVGPYAVDGEDLSFFGLSEGGNGPILTIEAGVSVVFREPTSFMLINRGSQLMALGTADAPITLSASSDLAFGGSSAPDATQLWGGLIINGFAVTNECSYQGTRGGSDFAFINPAGCHVLSEGIKNGQVHYHGGINDQDNSGILRYLIVKYAGAEIEAGHELNAVSFNAVGSGTTVENLQVYRAYDDGIELVGGAVNVENFLGLYVRDDSIDIDAGYQGTINRALIIQEETDGNRCIEADGIARYSDQSPETTASFIERKLNSRPVLSNISCIASANEGPGGHASVAGTHDPGEGVHLREGIYATISGLLVTNAYSTASPVLTSPNNDATDNWCLDIDSTETLAATAQGNLTITDSVFVCTQVTAEDGDTISSAGGDVSELLWLQGLTSTYTAATAPLINPGAQTNPELALFEQNSFRALALDQLRIPTHSSISFTVTEPGYQGADNNDWIDLNQAWPIALDQLWFDSSTAALSLSGRQ